MSWIGVGLQLLGGLTGELEVGLWEAVILPPFLHPASDPSILCLGKGRREKSGGSRVKTGGRE